MNICYDMIYDIYNMNICMLLEYIILHNILLYFYIACLILAHYCNLFATI